MVKAVIFYILFSITAHIKNLEIGHIEQISLKILTDLLNETASLLVFKSMSIQE